MRVKRWRETTLRYRLMQFIRRREVNVSLAVLAQLLALMLGLVYFGQHYVIFYFCSTAVGVLCALHVINGRSNPEMKAAWLVPILLVPFFGGVIYILLGRSRMSRKSRMRMERNADMLRRAFAREYQQQAQWLEPYGERVARESRGIVNMSGYPVFSGTDTEFLATGEIFWQRLLQELEKAQKYIFLEYYIIQEGEMWQRILDVLGRKAAQGVEVRLMYDDIGCISRLPADYPSKLRAMGIQVCVFNPYMPVLTSTANNRDHRKICVIDGNTAFVGGINLADEYIDRVRYFGYWKDSALVMRGNAAWGFAVMFLDMWDLINRGREDWSQFRPDPALTAGVRGQGLVQPMCTAPYSQISLSESTLINIIRNATKYVYLSTPYLIPTHDLITAMVTAARSGVDVRVITPNIPDKKIIFAATRAHYMQLIEAGVKVYEYSPGFMHAKQVVSDDRVAMVGSMNLDFRSMYLNYESMAWLLDVPCIADIRADMEETMRLSERITQEKCRALITSGSLPHRLLRSILRVFSPLM